MGTTLAFAVWKTIKLGTGLTTADDFCSAFKAANLSVGNGAIDALKSQEFRIAAELLEVDLVLISAQELGFEESTDLRTVYVRAKERGLGLCPAEVGPQLYLQYSDQPEGELLYVAMNQIFDSSDVPVVFHIENLDYGRYLHADYGDPDDICDPDYQLVFVLPKRMCA